MLIVRITLIGQILGGKSKFIHCRDLTNKCLICYVLAARHELIRIIVEPGLDFSFSLFRFIRPLNKIRLILVKVHFRLSTSLNDLNN